MPCANPWVGCWFRQCRSTVSKFRCLSRSCSCTVVCTCTTPRCMCWRSAGAGQRGRVSGGGRVFDCGCISQELHGQGRCWSVWVYVNCDRSAPFEFSAFADGNGPDLQYTSDNDSQATQHEIRIHKKKDMYLSIKMRVARVSWYRIAHNPHLAFTRELKVASDSPPYSHVRCGQSLHALS